MKLNLGCGNAVLTDPEWINVDRKPSTQGWEHNPYAVLHVSCVDLSYRWPWGDMTVELISISHLLYCMDWISKGHIISEAARVLRRSGIIRITDDDNDHPQSLYHTKLHHNSVERTSKAKILEVMRDLNLYPVELPAHFTYAMDKRILIDLHNDGPAVFFLEGQKR